jgi:hypothetical protein
MKLFHYKFQALENQDNQLIKIAFCLQPIKLNKYLMRQA